MMVEPNMVIHALSQGRVRAQTGHHTLLTLPENVAFAVLHRDLGQEFLGCAAKWILVLRKFQ